MRAKEFINREHALVFETVELQQHQLHSYFIERSQKYSDIITGPYFQSKIAQGFRHLLREDNIEENSIAPFIDKIQQIDYARKIKVGDLFCILNFELIYGFREIEVNGFTDPKKVSKIVAGTCGKINYIEFEDGDRYPRQIPANYAGRPVVYSIYFKSKDAALTSLSYALLVVPTDWTVTINPSLTQNNINEGGWANPATQNTHITPALVDHAFKILAVFIDNFNLYLKTKDIPAVELGYPCGSITYYKRDLVQNPDREYGDIDVNLFIPKIEGLTNNANATVYKEQIKEFCEQTQNFQTENGTNVIIKIGNDYVQVDFITAYFHNKEWTTALAPEYNVKGVLCNSLYSSLGEALSLSIGGGHGVQVKTQHGEIVPFRTNKDVVLKTITNNPKTWAIDIVKYFGCNKISPRLKAYPGMIDEIRVSDMINSIRGIAETLEMNNALLGYSSASDLIQKVKSIYLGKIQTAIDSSKYEKAQSPAAIEKANKTKELLADKSQSFASLFGK